MTREEIIAWLDSEEGEAWSRSRHEHCFFMGGLGPVAVKDPGPIDPSEDPTGRVPIKGPALIATREATA